MIWQGSGTFFYAIRNENGWARGFYMSVSIGYAIGFGYPVEIDVDCQIYSIFHVLVGASALTVLLLGFFII